ncbi:MAG TPA: hypothetical protein DCS12_04710 [Clostridiales bacterium]|nr:hypothetical protein [Clostridiales bacterium]
MGIYLKTPGGEEKRYNHQLNKLLSKIGQVYGDGTRCSGIKYIMRGIDSASKSQVKNLLQNRRKVIPVKHIEDNYIYKVSENNYINYIRNIIEAVSENEHMIIFIKQEIIFDDNSGNYINELFSDIIASLNLMVDKKIDNYPDKARELLKELKEVGKQI